MLTTDQARQILDGGNVVGTDGQKIGGVGQVFLDDATGEPEWVTVKTGLFGTAESFVPLTTATLVGHDVEVSFDKDTIKGAPRVKDSDGHLDPSEEAELYHYYGLGGDASGDQQVTDPTTDPTTDPGTDRVTGTDSYVGTDIDVTGGTGGESHDHDHGAGHDASGPDTDTAMTRSEEQLRVGTETVSAGKARLRKYVVTENVTQTVPVSHEEVRIEREPITDANRGDALSGADITSEEHEVDLTAERVVTDKEAVPVERVRMDVDTVTEDETVSEDVRKEQIDTDATDADGTADTSGTTHSNGRTS
ncbi:PRC and DUF2382 domain-containing protein [Nocardioides marinquilinus]|uniref:PRC and DUF2382 domain-containing protein n=1 Tax=Nocardioides marinquilinus TaxID=1210400 RepID=A0ABP9P6C8_9ACTN